MSGNPEKLIEQYLERVRVYLPIDCEDILAEIRTHIIETAEDLGEGRITQGSVTLAIEKLGAPQRVANEYAGTGEQVGPIPVEYKLPLIRTFLTIVGISIAFLFSGIAVSGFLLRYDIILFDYVSMILLSTVVSFCVLIVIAIFYYRYRDSTATDKTLLEHIFGIGVDAFRPKSRLDAAVEVGLNLLFIIILASPQVRFLLSPEFMRIFGPVFVMLVVSACTGLLFYLVGENTLNLFIEILVDSIWIVLAMAIVNIGWPTDYLLSLHDGTWSLMSINALMAEMNLSFNFFDIMWIFIVFMLILTSMWEVMADSIKVRHYIQEGRGWWWHGTWRTRRYHRISRHWWEREPELPPSEE